MNDFIDPSWIKTSDYPPNFLPAGSIAIDQSSEDGDCTVKGFYDPKTGEYHIQEVLHNVKVRGPEAALSPEAPSRLPRLGVRTMTEVEELTRQLATERERADYAWRNTRTIEAARAEEMRKRDAAEAENARLRKLLRQGLRQLAAWQEKYGEWQPQWLPPSGDVRWAEDVSEALATPND